MLKKQENPTTLPGVFSTLAAGFELSTRYLWLMIVPALLDLFLWIGPRLSFRPLIESLAAQLPPQALPLDLAPVLDTYAARLNHFTYLSVPLLGVPALMTGLTPEKTPIQPLVLERSGMGEWFGYFLLFTLGGLLLAAVYYSLIAYALSRAGASAAGTVVPPVRLGRRTVRTWLRLMGLALMFLAFLVVVAFPTSIVVGFASLLSQTLAVLILMGALVLIIWIVMFLSYTPQGMTLNPGRFAPSLIESVRLFRANLPASLGLLFVVTLARRALSLLLLTADSGTWVTGINLLAHAYITTALIVSMFIFYRDRYTASLQQTQLPNNIEQVK
ncbi:MAG: hypothetical protein KA586_11665 [Candidatus Promineofilum sp.]|nr:hypothetical protein [Promineifilum sp.]